LDYYLRPIFEAIYHTFALQDEANMTEQIINFMTYIFSNILNVPIMLIGLFIFGRVCSHY